MVDSGSSTLVVKPGSYRVESDAALRATPVVQEVNYGIGGWACALVYTQLSFSQDGKEAFVIDTSVAVVESDPMNMFACADGILGLAFAHLNKSFDLSEYFADSKTNPPLSYPWPFQIEKDIKSTKNLLPPKFSNLRAFKSFLWRYPEHDVTPLFSQIADRHLVANKFAFYAKRSSIHVAELGLNIIEGEPKCFADDPLNLGLLILGGGEEQTHLYRGEFKAVKVFNDVYYNVNLISVRVEGGDAIQAEPLASKDKKNYYTNAIMDTGSTLTVLPHTLYSVLIAQLSSLNPEFSSMLEPFLNIEQQYIGIDSDKLNLADWPNIEFIFEGESGEAITLTCKPENYWQVNTPELGKACFKLLGQLPNWPNQTIVGLPLLTNYFVVFDRSAKVSGVVKFAKQK